MGLKPNRYKIIPQGLGKVLLTIKISQIDLKSLLLYYKITALTLINNFFKSKLHCPVT